MAFLPSVASATFSCEIVVVIVGHSWPIPKVRPHGLYFVYYPVGIFFRDRPSLTHSDNKLASQYMRKIATACAKPRNDII